MRLSALKNNKPIGTITLFLDTVSWVSLDREGGREGAAEASIDLVEGGCGDVYQNVKVCSDRLTLPLAFSDVTYDSDNDRLGSRNRPMVL